MRTLITNHRVKGAMLAIAAVSLSVSAPLAAGDSRNSRVPAGQALLIGGDTPRGIDVDGQNRSSVPVEMLVERANEDGVVERRVVRTLAPRERFVQYIRADEAVVFRNTSDEVRATVYWHVSGYSKAANPRIE